MRAPSVRKHNIDSAAILGILIVFAIGAVLCIVSAVRIYTNTAEQASINSDASTAAAYISQKIHQNDVSGSIRLGTIDGQKSLIIEQEINEQKYRTYIYHYDGYLRELFARTDFDASAKDGDRIIPLKSMTITKSNSNLYTFKCVSLDGHTDEITVATRSH